MAQALEKPTPISDLLPHSGKMVLLDEVKSVSEQRVVCETLARAEHAQLAGVEGSVPNWIALEYMAQAAAVLAGSSGGEPRVGFLVSVKSFKASVSSIPLNTRLQVEAELFAGNLESAVFKARVCEKGQELIQADLHVHIPRNL